MGLHKLKPQDLSTDSLQILTVEEMILCDPEVNHSIVSILYYTISPRSCQSELKD